jgi:SAM-dependent methyltransferase
MEIEDHCNKEKEAISNEIKELNLTLRRLVTSALWNYYNTHGGPACLQRAKEILRDVKEVVLNRKDIRVGINFSDLYGETTPALKKSCSPEVEPESALRLYLLPYIFALDYVVGRQVLDVGCGYGYGVDAFSEKAKFVVGADYDLDALKYATVRYKRRNVAFVRLDGNKGFPFASASFDTVFSSNCIEQVKHYENLLSEMRRVLKKEGQLILKTRNARFASKEQNPYHHKVFYPDEIRELLQSRFSQVEVCGYNVLNSFGVKKERECSGEGKIKFGERVPFGYRLVVNAFMQGEVNKRPEDSRFMMCLAKK